MPSNMMNKPFVNKQEPRVGAPGVSRRMAPQPKVEEKKQPVGSSRQAAVVNNRSKPTPVTNPVPQRQSRTGKLISNVSGMIKKKPAGSVPV